MTIATVLSLAAAPTFICMAVATGLLGGDPATMICSAAGASHLTGMAFMYGLMAVFHLPPWARLMGRRSLSA